MSEQPTLVCEMWPEIPVLEFPCPSCGRVVATRGCVKTLVGHSFDGGHIHDGNCRRFTCLCPCGITFVVRPINSCPVPGCEWRGKAECRICGPWLKVMDYEERSKNE